MQTKGQKNEVIGINLIDDGGNWKYNQMLKLAENGIIDLAMTKISQSQRFLETPIMKEFIGNRYDSNNMILNQNLLRQDQKVLNSFESKCCDLCFCTSCLKLCLGPCFRRKISKVISNLQGFEKKNQNLDYPINKLIYSGQIYKLQKSTWVNLPIATVTTKVFINEPLQSIKKVKIKKEIIHNQCLFLTTTDQNLSIKQYAIPRIQHIDWFCSIIWAAFKLQSYDCNLHDQFNEQKEGKILRKSKYLQSWAFRDVVIDNDGLKSYKNRQHKPTTRIHKITQLWTRFQLIQNNQYLVLNFNYQGLKYHYGIPLNDSISWIKAFYSLLA